MKINIKSQRGSDYFFIEENNALYMLDTLDHTYKKMKVSLDVVLKQGYCTIPAPTAEQLIIIEKLVKKIRSEEEA